MIGHSIDHDVTGAQGSLARLEGRRDALRIRREELTREIELAKGRLAVKDEVEAFIEAVHGSASRRSLSAFETLLTALVQEVLPGEKPVALDLSTERGLASLDICVRRPDGSLEDVLEDNGGALTNVVGMALRLIAVVKADVARFLALDEADCWIAPDRVSSFYRVLEDGAARLGVQCLAVSHHDLSQFSGKFHIARIVGEPVSGVDVQSSDTSAAWDDVQPGLRFIRLANVQAYKDATLPLSPGVNALIGPNNRGKSTFIRALRAVFYGEARDSLVRAGAKAASVEIGVAGRRTLRFTRQPRRSPVNIWSLHESDGSIVEERGMRYETGGRSVPDWVADLIRIRKVEDLDVHIAHQKFPVFLLGETPSRRSAVLSIGQEAGYIRDMLVIHRERCRRDNDLVRNGERELIALGEALEGLKDLDGLKDRLSAIRRLGDDLKDASAHLQTLQQCASQLADLNRRLEKAQARAEITAKLPEAEQLAHLTRMVERSRERERLGGRVIGLSHSLAWSRARLAALQSLPEALPTLENTSSAQNILKRMNDLRSAALIAQSRIAQVDEGLTSLQAEMAQLVEETGGLCPTCGAPVKPENLLDHHAHPSLSSTPSERLTA
ncbi:AAA family ATPase [Microvirga tunisiensis]|uniref:AAA family ATPase n=1 Tax=Microvirga tunisiensis TaxID=2108360 RepID=A0A5N7MSR1_9HYPH|nr:AAA family ATPase [Microvirga tunisiensis]MPR11028.1 AAA family ATPase [Microvirga tunisiensis]MPR29144.1 AAA family ATPase [Microvirga tunisiensis]